MPFHMHTPSFPYLNRCNVGEQEVREESRRGRGVIYRSADSCRRLEDEVCSEEGFDPARVFRLRQGCGERMGVIIMPFLLSAATHPNRTNIKSRPSSQIFVQSTMARLLLVTADLLISFQSRNTLPGGLGRTMNIADCSIFSTAIHSP